MSTDLKTICNRDCPDACGMVATVEDGRVTKIAGDPDHPVTQGFLCERTRQFLSQQYHPDRVTQPLLKKDGSLQPVSWDEALDACASNLGRIREESGPAAIFHYRSGGSLGALKHVADFFFQEMGPVTSIRGSICSGAGQAAQVADFGVCESSDLFDLENARHIILWGKNLVVSSPHTIPVVRRAIKNGAQIMLIDPVHHRTTTLCQTYLQPRPAGDLALAMAIARTLFENNWIDANAANVCKNLDEFRAFAHTHTVEAWCAQADVDTAAALDIARRLSQKPAAILVGWGMARRKNGAAMVRALDALGAITGNLGISGGGVSYYFGRKTAFDMSFIDKTPPRTIAEPLFGPGMLAAKDPPVRAVWVTAGNPVVMLPDSQATVRALGQCEFVVVVDSLLTDTAELADVVFPATTLLEDDDLLGAFGHHYIGVSTPVVRPPQGVRHELAIWQGVAERMGFGDKMRGTPSEWKQRMLGDIDLAKLEKGVQKNPDARAILFADGKFPTDSGRVHLMTEKDATFAPTLDPHYPLTLLSLSTEKAQCSQWARPPESPLVVTVHPDAANRFPDGAIATLASRMGSLTVRVKHDTKQRTDVAIVPKGGHLRRGMCVNTLIRAELTDHGEGGSLYDEPVRLE